MLPFLSFVALAGTTYGLFLAVFRKGRRRRGVGVVVGSIFAMGLLGVMMQDQMAQDAGFLDAEDMKIATSFSISDPNEWRDVRENLTEQYRLNEEQAKAEAAAQREAEQAAAQQRRDEERQREQAAEARAVEEERTAGFHCLSSWDGSHRNFKQDVERRMREPDSFEHIETRVTPVSANGTHTIMMKYRARNGFGGMNVGTAIGTYSNANCQHTIVSVE